MPETQAAPTTRTGPGLLLIALAYVGFISLGLPDAVTGVAWPTIRDTFGLAQGAIGMVFMASGLGYFVTSFISGRLTQALGIGLLLAISTALVAGAMFGFATAPIWGVFVACAVVHGLGSGAIDAGLNGYAANYLSARHMNWLHACYCFGAMLGPLLMTAVLAAGRPYSVGYSAVGGVLLTLAALFLATRPRWGQTSSTAAEVGPQVKAGEALQHPAVLLQMALFFLYTGLEMTFSQWAYTVLTEARGVEPVRAGSAVGLYWGSIGAGRVVFGMVADRVGIDRLLRYCLLAAVAGAVLFAIPLTAPAAFAGLALAGFGLAPVFPCLMTRTPQRLGAGLSGHAVGFQVGAAMIGAAAVPATLGLVGSRVGLEAVPIGAAILAGLVWMLHEGLVRRPDVANREGGRDSAHD
ncbi:MFS transporter [Tundrisphaera lichenicola]|uniref:MFS transporter n=1 Tax=Tundrisphaera lichenicola TaxID=2029860 RepID=UPI003EBF4C2F